MHLEYGIIFVQVSGFIYKSVLISLKVHSLFALPLFQAHMNTRLVP